MRHRFSNFSTGPTGRTFNAAGAILLIPACCLLSMVLPTNLFAQSWTLTGLDGSTTTAEVKSIDEGKISAGDESQWNLDEYRKLKTPHALLGADPSTTEVRLVHGGVVFSREIKLESGKVHLETDVCELDYDIFDVRCVLFQKGEGEAELDKLLENPSSETDQLLVTTSQGPRTVSGLIESINQESVAIDYRGEVRNISRDKIIALLPARLDSGRKLLGQLTTIDRSRLLVEQISFVDGKWTVDWGDNKVELSNEYVAELSIRSDRQIYLSDLEPIRNEVQTMLAPRRSTQLDLNTFGQPITLHLPPQEEGEVSVVKEFSKGLGTQSRSQLSFVIPDGCIRLTGWVGIDAAAKPHGNCVCSVLVDGIQVFSANVTGADNAVAIDLPLENAREIQLLVEPGKQMDLSDWVDLADIRFLK